MHLLQLGATRVRLAGAVQPHRNYLRPFLSSVVAIEVRSIILNCLAFKQISIAPNIVRVGFFIDITDEKNLQLEKQIICIIFYHF
jgi:hypothetical protein